MSHMRELTSKLTLRASPSPSPSPQPRWFLDAVPEHLLCPICRQTLREPTRFACGKHTFCAGCVVQWEDASASRARRRDVPCPMCRVSARDSGLSNSVDETKIRMLRCTVIACGCGREVNLLNDAGTHECGMSSGTLGTAFGSSGGGSARVDAHVVDDAVHDADTDTDTDDDDDPLYLCPHCEEDYIRDAGVDVADGEDDYDSNILPETCFFRGMREFSEHVMFAHNDDPHARPAVCPMCAALPHGDASMLVLDLYDHVSRRHAFDWSLYMPDIHHVNEYDVIAETIRISREEAERAGHALT